MTTLANVYRAARSRLTQAGVDSAALDSRLLVSHVTGSSLEDIVCRPMAEVAPEAARRIDDAVSRRIAGEPTHRIIGAREFFGLPLDLSPDTLEPRPDTEALVELVAPRVREIAAKTGVCRILDLGTGTGAILLALLSEEARATGVMTDISPGALATAQANAKRLGLAGRAEAIVSDWFSGVDGTFDVIVSNPPYIPSADIGELSREVREHDPMRALDGGADGLDAYRAIAAGAAAHLAAAGVVAVEIGAGQGPDVRRLFADCGFDRAESLADLGGRERALLFVANAVDK